MPKSRSKTGRSGVVVVVPAATMVARVALGALNQIAEPAGVRRFECWNTERNVRIKTALPVAWGERPTTTDRPRLVTAVRNR